MIIIFLLLGLVSCEDYLHDPIQYHFSDSRGTYKFGYDTGLHGAHQFHQEYKDENGVVRGRYGYTDPDGKLRLTYYTSGKDGYRAWGPDEKEPVSTFNSLPLSTSITDNIKSSNIVSNIKNTQIAQKTLYSPVEQFRARITGKTNDKSVQIGKISQKLTKLTQISKAHKISSPIKQEEITVHILPPPKSLKKESIKGSSTYVSPAKSARAVSKEHSYAKNYASPTTPNRYKPNYPPAGPYTRCYCE